MTPFAFIIHPLELSDIYRKYGWLRWFPKGINDREREMILLLDDLELAA